MKRPPTRRAGRKFQSGTVRQQEFGEKNTRRNALVEPLAYRCPLTDWAPMQNHSKGCDNQLELNITASHSRCRCRCSLLLFHLVNIPSQTYRFLFPLDPTQSCCSLSVKYASLSLCHPFVCSGQIFPPSHLTKIPSNISLPSCLSAYVSKSIHRFEYLMILSLSY